MKNIIIGMAVIVIALTACNSGNNGSNDIKTLKGDSSVVTKDTVQVYACPMHPEVTGKKGDTCYKCGMNLAAVKIDEQQTNVSTSNGAKSTVSINGIVSSYLQLKNALAGDNTTNASAAGTAVGNALKNFDKTALNAPQQKTFEDIADDATEHAEHISKNGGNIAHQREHFEMLSKDIYDLVKAFGGGQALYKDFCPMYNKNKGAFWISETKEIKNPYLGKAMPTCGSIKEEIK